MRPTKTEIKINNNKLIKLKSRHYEIIVKRLVVKEGLKCDFITPKPGNKYGLND